jgi:hypothetical protein
MSVAQYTTQAPPGIPRIGRRKAEPKDDRPTLQTQGVVRSNDGKRLVVSADDGRIFNIALTDKTTYAQNAKTIAGTAVLVGSTVQVEADRDNEENLTAIRVDVLKAPEPKAAPAAAEASEPKSESKEDDSVRPTISQAPVEAPNRPVLHHGAGHRETNKVASNDSAGLNAPPGKAQNEDDADDGVTVIPDASASTARKPSSSAELVERAREWVASFSGSLPNYVVHQSTTRYQEESKATGWRALDIVTAEVVYEDGKESYRNITVGGKKTNKSMLEVGGTVSTGEFGSMLRSLFSPISQANFKPFRSARVGQTEALIYDFKVELRNSNWQITVGGQTLRPAYSGSVWIDKNTAEVRRLEMQANAIPADFPLDTIESAVDYDKVMLGTGSFLLPVHAENLGCQRGSSVCMKNTVEFRNYHKYAGESTIEFAK